jgi:hypothetical protein
MQVRKLLPGRKFLKDLRRERRNRPSNIPTEIEAMRVTRLKRLVHVDRYVIRNCGFSKSKPVRFLDVGCCPMLNGAPTTSTTKAEFRKANYKMDITAVDKFLPEELKSSDPEIKFKQMDITKVAPGGQFDFVRAANIFEYLKGAEAVSQARKHIYDSVCEGGILAIDSSSKAIPEHAHKVVRSAGLVVLRKVNGNMEFLKYIDTQSHYRSKRLGLI